MKKNGINHEIYYCLLEWKDNNMGLFQLVHGEKSLNDLSTDELIALAKAIGYLEEQILSY